MNLQSHFILMSKYNLRMNNQVYNFIRELNDVELNRDRGAYFQSIMGTLNHILVGDLIWLTRFSTHSERYVSLLALSMFPKPSGLNSIVFSSLSSLIEAREKIDLLLCNWLENETNENDFNELLSYSNSKGVESERDFGELLSHLFNHQTHHRGQLSTLLHQIKIDVGVTDFLYEIPDSKA